MKNALADIAEPMLAAGWNEDRLVSYDNRLLVTKPNFGSTLKDFENFLDGVQMDWRAKPLFAPLIEDAELVRAG